MENKKFNFFGLFLVIVMAIFTIYTGINNKNAKDGKDGMSAYELAVSTGEFTGTELEYLLSLHGKDGSNITIEDLYQAYLKVTNKVQSDETYLEFISSYFDNLVLDDKAEVSLVEAATQVALRSTVDICYADYMKTPIIEVSENGDKYVIDTSKNETYAAISLSAGSGVIYQINDDSAYIITNYHVLYADNYSNDPNYRVYRKTDVEGNQTYFTGTYNSSNVKYETVGSLFGSMTYYYINKSDITLAPIETHFLETYDVYLYGYQSAEYAISASFVGGSADNDIAVLKVDKNDDNVNNKLLFNGTYRPAVLGNSTELNTGRTVIAVGNPLIPNIEDQKSSTVKDYVKNLEQNYIDALCLTATSGDVSNVSEDRNFGSIIEAGKEIQMRLIRVSAAINAGNSGGGLYDITGKLVGIVNGKIVSEEYDNVGYAIPINIASRIADRIISDCEGISGQTRIKIVTSETLGISVKDGNKNASYDLKWSFDNNVIVESLSTSKKPYLNGMVEGSIIESIEIDGEEYFLNYSYEIDDILLNIDINDSSTHTIIFKTKISVENQVKDKQVTVIVTASDFTEIK